MGLTDTLITILILLAITILAYCKITNKTLVELVQEIREIFREKEEVIDFR